MRIYRCLCLSVCVYVPVIFICFYLCLCLLGACASVYVNNKIYLNRNTNQQSLDINTYDNFYNWFQKPIKAYTPSHC